MRVAAPASEGRANAAVRRALAAALRLPQSAVVLTRGASAKRKAFAVAGMDQAAALAALRAASEV